MVHKESDRGALTRIDLLAGFSSLFNELMIELNKQKRLILYCRKQVIVPNQIKYVGPPQTKEVRQSFSWLAICGVSRVVMG